MTRHMRFVAVWAVSLSTAGLAGCLKTTGGGKLTGSIHGGTVTTGFQIRCEDLGASGHVTGEFQYHDHGTDVAFHAVIDESLLAITGENLTCEALDQRATAMGLQGTFITLGTYTPQPKTRGEGGQILVTIQDQNNTFGFACAPGVDALAVQVISGVYTGYAEGGCLDKGNFTVFSE